MHSGRRLPLIAGRRRDAFHPHALDEKTAVLLQEPYSLTFRADWREESVTMKIIFYGKTPGFSHALRLSFHSDAQGLLTSSDFELHDERRTTFQKSLSLY